MYGVLGWLEVADPARTLRDREQGQLPQPLAGVEEHADDRGVAPILEPRALQVFNGFRTCSGRMMGGGLSGMCGGDTLRIGDSVIPLRPPTT